MDGSGEKTNKAVKQQAEKTEIPKQKIYILAYAMSLSLNGGPHSTQQLCMRVNDGTVQPVIDARSNCHE